MRENREQIESAVVTADQVTPAFLAAQRRTIYQRMNQPEHWWSAAPVRRWAAGVATVCVLAGSGLVYEQNRERQIQQERMEDAKLVQEVAAMARDTDVSAMAPLEGLFE
jgi:hypothetical protein